MKRILGFLARRARDRSLESEGQLTPVRESSADESDEPVMLGRGVTLRGPDRASTLL